MSRPKIKVTAFLEFSSDQDTWEVSPDYMKAVEGQLESVPTLFSLPWPADLIPSVGEKIWNSNMMAPADELTVKEVEYRYSRRTGITAYIKTEATGGATQPFNDHGLTYAAEEGFLLEDYTPIFKALKAAGLPTTRKAMK